MSLTDKQMKRLREHAKDHRGGMRSKHMRSMVKHMKDGHSFTKAHNATKKEMDHGECECESKGRGREKKY
jgi:hypothetical protein